MPEWTGGIRCQKASGLHGLAQAQSAKPPRAIPRRFDDRGRDQVRVVDTENPLDLSEKSSEEPAVSARHFVFRLAITSIVTPLVTE